MENLYLELVDEKHHKFYELFQLENIITVTYGRIGRNGKSKSRNFSSNIEALNFFQKMKLKKEKKGYKLSIKGITPSRVKAFHPNQLAFCFLIHI